MKELVLFALVFLLGTVACVFIGKAFKLYTVGGLGIAFAYGCYYCLYQIREKFKNKD